jgi:hypothetical protein
MMVKWAIGIVLTTVGAVSGIAWWELGQASADLRIEERFVEHVEEFEYTKAKVLYEDCLRRCDEVCEGLAPTCHERCIRQCKERFLQ